MPVGRFRKNPRELDDLEKKVSAAQYPEGSLLFGMGAGLVLPMAAQAATQLPATVDTLGTGFGPVVGGIAGYLLGHVYKEARLESLRRSEHDGGGDSGLPEPPDSRDI